MYAWKDDQFVLQCNHSIALIHRPSNMSPRNGEWQKETTRDAPAKYHYCHISTLMPSPAFPFRLYPFQHPQHQSAWSRHPFCFKPGRCPYLPSPRSYRWSNRSQRSLLVTSFLRYHPVPVIVSRIVDGRDHFFTTKVDCFFVSFRLHNVVIIVDRFVFFPS